MQNRHCIFFFTETEPSARSKVFLEILTFCDLLQLLQVDFKCLSAGVYVAEMKVVSTPVASTSGDIETSSASVSLQGFAEEPKIEVNIYAPSYWLVMWGNQILIDGISSFGRGVTNICGVKK